MEITQTVLFCNIFCPVSFARIISVLPGKSHYFCSWGAAVPSPHHPSPQLVRKWSKFRIRNGILTSLPPHSVTAIKTLNTRLSDPQRKTACQQSNIYWVVAAAMVKILLVIVAFLAVTVSHTGKCVCSSKAFGRTKHCCDTFAHLGFL